jgi:hypothetical protein
MDHYTKYPATSDTTGRVCGTATEQRIQWGANFHVDFYFHTTRPLLDRGVGRTRLKSGVKRKVIAEVKVALFSGVEKASLLENYPPARPSDTSSVKVKTLRW